MSKTIIMTLEQTQRLKYKCQLWHFTNETVPKLMSNNYVITKQLGLFTIDKCEKLNNKDL